VERHWREVNKATRKWYLEFQNLEGLGVLDVSCDADLFSLIEVYFNLLERNLSEHYESMGNRLKRKSTRNPNYPTGTHRRFQLYSLSPNMLNRCTQTEIDQIAVIGQNHFLGVSQTASWQIDPLTTEELRQSRRDALEWADWNTRAELYVAHVNATSYLRRYPDDIDDLGAYLQFSLQEYRQSRDNLDDGTG